MQGVGFRACTCARARALGITGWVRNTHDGCVEAAAQGTPAQLAEFEDWLRRGPPAARVDGVEVFLEAATAPLAGFTQR